MGIQQKIVFSIMLLTFIMITVKLRKNLSTGSPGREPYSESLYSGLDVIAMATPRTVENTTKPKIFVLLTVVLLNSHVVFSAGLMSAPVLDRLILSGH